MFRMVTKYVPFQTLHFLIQLDDISVENIMSMMNLVCHYVAIYDIYLVRFQQPWTAENDR